MLTIGVDARELLGATTGVGRYLGELLRRWAGRADAPRLVLFSPEPLAPAFGGAAIEVRVTGRGRGTWWEQTSLRRAVRREPLDVFFAPGYTAPLGLRVPLALTIHDVSFFAHPEWFRPREGVRRRLLTGRAAASAAVVLTDSEFSRREIQAYLRLPASRVRVIPPGLSPRHVPAARPRERLVLYAGSIFNRRRLPDLIEAFARATAGMPDARLVIVGENRTWPPQDLAAAAMTHGILARVELRSYVDEAALGELYGRAAAFAFLSEYEGFGLTPLEALAAGVPAVVLDTPVAREVYGPAVTYVSRGDIDGTARALRELLGTPGVPVPPAAAGVLARYSWDDAAAATLAEIARAATRP